MLDQTLLAAGDKHAVVFHLIMDEVVVVML